MPFPRIRKLPCQLSNLLGDQAKIPKFTYFNPSSCTPYLYIRTIEKMGTASETNHITIYHRETGVMKCIKTPPEMLLSTCGFYRGIEDARIFLYQGRLWFIATSTHISDNYLSQMMIGRMDEEVTRVEFVQHLDFGVRPLKNTCPFVHEDRIFVIDTFTLCLYTIEGEAQEDGKVVYRPVLHKKLAPCAGLAPHTMRGSTCPIHLHGNLWGCIVHEHIRQAREKMMSLAYISYWMEFDLERGAVTYVSSPFVAAHWGIEFISGIEYYRDRDEVELFLGVNDQMAVVAKTKLYDLRVGQ